MSAAVSQYGPQVSVCDARRIRAGGVLGFFSRERYEVTAAPGADPNHARERIDSTLRGLVDAVEADGRPTSFARVLAATVDQSPSPAPPPATQPALPAADTGAWVDGLASFLERPEPMVDISERAVAAGTAPTMAAPTTDAVPTAIPVPAPPTSIAGEPAWSRGALRELGVPAAVLSRLPAEDPGADLDWTAALGRAIAAVIPISARLSEQTPTVVSGFGRESAIRLVRACAEGLVPGVLLIDGNEVPATPTELALGVRACLPR